MKKDLRLEDITLTRKELALRWKCSEETLKRRQKTQLLKALKIGRLVRYRLSDVLEVERGAAI
jgi:hypothetical protein